MNHDFWCHADCLLSQLIYINTFIVTNWKPYKYSDFLPPSCKCQVSDGNRFLATWYQKRCFRSYTLHTMINIKVTIRKQITIFSREDSYVQVDNSYVILFIQRFESGIPGFPNILRWFSNCLIASCMYFYGAIFSESVGA